MLELATVVGRCFQGDTCIYVTYEQDYIHFNYHTCTGANTATSHFMCMIQFTILLHYQERFREIRHFCTKPEVYNSPPIVYSWKWCSQQKSDAAKHRLGQPSRLHSPTGVGTGRVPSPTGVGTGRVQSPTGVGTGRVQSPTGVGTGRVQSPTGVGTGKMHIPTGVGSGKEKKRHILC